MSTRFHKNLAILEGRLVRGGSPMKDPKNGIQCKLDGGENSVIWSQLLAHRDSRRDTALLRSSEIYRSLYRSIARIGLIGPKGSGKSTLLAILQGRGKQDSGDITMRKGSTLSYVAQVSEFAPNDTTRSSHQVRKATSSLTRSGCGRSTRRPTSALIRSMAACPAVSPKAL